MYEQYVRFDGLKQDWNKMIPQGKDEQVKQGIKSAKLPLRPTEESWTRVLLKGSLQKITL
jgi:hypothetical protein